MLAIHVPLLPLIDHVPDIVAPDSVPTKMPPGLSWMSVMLMLLALMLPDMWPSEPSIKRFLVEREQIEG